jgi:hypothetical protein
MEQNRSGLSALSPIVSAADEFIRKKNIPPDQVPAYLFSIGSPELAGLTAKYQRLKTATQAMPQQGGPPPAPPTVADDVNNQLMQYSGVASLPAPVMDNAQFAGGGIVAFSGGDLVEDELQEALRIPAAQRTPRQNELIRREGTRQFVAENMPNTPGLPVTGVGRTQLPAENVTRREPPAQKRRTQRNPTAAVAEATPATAEKKPGFGVDAESNVTLLEDMQRRAGIGAAATEREEAIKADKAEGAKQAKSDKWLSVAQAGFKTLQAASRPGATFLGSLGEGGVDLTASIRDINKEMRQNQREAQQQLYQIQLGREQMKAGNIEKGATLAQNAQERLDELNWRQEQLKVQREQIASNESIARLRAADSGSGSDSYLKMLQNELVDARKAKDSAREAEVLKEIRKYREASTAAGISADAADERALRALIAKDQPLQLLQNLMSTTTDANRKAQLQEEFDNRVQQLTRGPSSNSATTSSTPRISGVTSSGTQYSIIE